MTDNSKDKPKIIWITLNPLQSSSLANVSNNLLAHLTKKYDVTVLGAQYKGQPIKTNGYTLLQFNNFAEIPYYMEKIKPEATVCFLGYMSTSIIQAIPSSILNSLIFYTTVETSTFPPMYVKSLQKVKRMVTTSKYSQDVLEKAGIQSTVVYHGVDTSFFKPHERNNTAFTYGYLGTDCNRKQLSTLLLAYSNLKLPSKRLHMATQLTPQINRIIQGLNIHVDFQETIKQGRTATNEEVRNFYYNLDCYVGLGTEGFGLPPLEAAATGIPNIAQDYGASREVLGNSAIYIKPVTTAYDEWTGENGVVDHYQVTEAMQYLRDNENERKKLSRNGIERAKIFTWETASKQIEKIINEQIAITKTTATQPLYIKHP